MISTYKKVIKFISTTLKPNNNTLLGRWSLKNDCIKKETISVFWANSDNCGDNICGNLIKNKSFLEKKLNNVEKVEKKKYEVINRQHNG